ncbi:hypothetical protein RRG08_033539 [Elysia crispata]|uniref:Ig-like domain-containing protein n=1 Tax=Elysia crispata TaxID=231223 RepID=A0AAE0XNS1_9GAST|nr:hypothetical protein RRG08_033539 [Elysia crispata]
MWIPRVSRTYRSCRNNEAIIVLKTISDAKCSASRPANITPSGKSSGPSDKWSGREARFLGFCLSQDVFYFSVTPESTEAVEGSETKLYCDVSDRRHIAFQWMQRGKQVQNTSRKYQEDSNLRILRVMRGEDEGPFSCIATNVTTEFAMESQEASLRIICEILPLCHAAQNHVLNAFLPARRSTKRAIRTVFLEEMRIVQLGRGFGWSVIVVGRSILSRDCSKTKRSALLCAAFRKLILSTDAPLWHRALGPTEQFQTQLTHADSLSETLASTVYTVHGPCLRDNLTGS